MKKFVWMLVVVMLFGLMGPAGAEDAVPEVREVALDLMGSSIRYPQLTGLADADVQQAVNDAVMQAGQIEARLNRAAALISAPVKLNVSYECTWFDPAGVFSCAILTDGAVTNNRATQEWAGVNIDLRTGEEITLEQLFTDADETRAALETLLEEQVAPDMSAHLAAGSLAPLPDTFTISPQGITFRYPIRQFRTLADRAGTVTVLWSEIREYLRLEEGAVLHGAALHLTLDETSRERIAAAIADGSLDGIPAAVGEGMQGLIDRYALLNDPDIYEGGRMIALEDGAFRKVWLLTDGLTEEFENSVVQAIRADRLCLHGLMTGVTTMEAWRAALGGPEYTVTVDGAQAESWCIVPGTSDYYTMGEYRLRLHADESGVLTSVFLMQ